MLNILILLIVVFLVAYIGMVEYLKYAKNKFTQPFLEIGPEHQKKMGTPTMGGIVFLSVYIFFILLISLFSNFLGIKIDHHYITLIIISILGYGLIGLFDDLGKVKYKENELGLSPKSKIFFQLLVSLIIVFFLIQFKSDTSITLYLFGAKLYFPQILYYLLVPFIFISATNATNLTDGLDGLLASNAIITLFFLALVAYDTSNITIVITNFIFIAALVAFLWFNRFPAKVFMGDVGSLTIGALFAAEAVILKIEILFIIFMFIYIIEVVSVILQFSYFKYTKKKYGKGKRLFLMAPIHHHFEKKGLKENDIVKLFCILNIIFSMIGFIIFKIY